MSKRTIDTSFVCNHLKPLNVCVDEESTYGEYLGYVEEFAGSRVDLIGSMNKPDIHENVFKELSRCIGRERNVFFLLRGNFKKRKKLVSLLRKRYSRLRKRYDEMKRKVEEKRTKIRHLMKERNDESYDEMKREVEEKRTKIRHLMKERNDESKEKVVLFGIVEKAVSYATTMDSENKEFQEERKNLESNIDTQRSKIHDLQIELASQRELLTQMEKMKNEEYNEMFKFMDKCLEANEWGFAQVFAEKHQEVEELKVTVKNLKKCFEEEKKRSEESILILKDDHERTKKRLIVLNDNLRKNQEEKKLWKIRRIKDMEASDLKVCSLMKEIREVKTDHEKTQKMVNEDRGKHKEEIEASDLKVCSLMKEIREVKIDNEKTQKMVNEELGKQKEEIKLWKTRRIKDMEASDLKVCSLKKEIQKTQKMVNEEFGKQKEEIKLWKTRRIKDMEARDLKVCSLVKEIREVKNDHEKTQKMVNEELGKQKEEIKLWKTRRIKDTEASDLKVCSLMKEIREVKTDHEKTQKMVNEELGKHKEEIKGLKDCIEGLKVLVGNKKGKE